MTELGGAEEERDQKLTFTNTEKAVGDCPGQCVFTTGKCPEHSGVGPYREEVLESR